MNVPSSHASAILVAALLLSSCAEEAKNPSISAPSNDKTTSTPLPIAPDQAQTTTELVNDPNPAHGEPGHRCEIPVGASLSAAPAPGTMQPATPPTPITTTIPSPAMPDAANGPTAPGMNPPHGQPGHDCAVAVGSPLPK